MAILLDTSFLLAMSNNRDAYHSVARAAIRALTDKRVIVAPVLPEAFYMLTVRVSYASACRLFDTLRDSTFRIEALTNEDMVRMSQIMAKYADNDFDFVDVAIMAVSERLTITEVYTLDRRDFRILRPAHCPALALLP